MYFHMNALEDSSKCHIIPCILNLDPIIYTLKETNKHSNKRNSNIALY